MQRKQHPRWKAKARCHSHMRSNNRGVPSPCTMPMAGAEAGGRAWHMDEVWCLEGYPSRSSMRASICGTQHSLH